MAIILSGDDKEMYLSLNKEVRSLIDSEMKSLDKQVDIALQKLSLEYQDFEERRTTLPKKEIASQLSDLQRDGGGMFANASKTLTDVLAGKLFDISEDIFFSDMKTETDFIEDGTMLMWQAMLVNTCPDCLALHGSSKTRKRWVDTGGVPNDRNTKCTIHGKCNCVLIPTEFMPSKEDMRAPIKIQAERIRKAEKKRGKKYAKSTKTSFLGQVNAEKGTLTDLRKVKKVNKK